MVGTGSTLTRTITVILAKTQSTNTTHIGKMTTGTTTNGKTTRTMQTTTGGGIMTSKTQMMAGALIGIPSKETMMTDGIMMNK